MGSAELQSGRECWNSVTALRKGVKRSLCRVRWPARVLSSSSNVGGFMLICKPLQATGAWPGRWIQRSNNESFSRERDFPQVP